MNGSDLFAKQVATLGYEPEVDGDWVLFDFDVPAGTFEGETVRMAIEVPKDFPRNPPGGINFSPRLRLENTGADHPERSHATRYNDFDEGEYWSRPHPDWAAEKHKNAQGYMSYVRQLWRTT